MDNYAANNARAGDAALQDPRHSYNAVQGGGLAGMQKQPPAIRQRIQEANKRLGDISGKLSFVVSEVAPPIVMNALVGENSQPIAAPTLTTDVDDLIREIGRIEGHVTRLALAISG